MNVNNATAVQSMAQEAMETAAQTKAEAAKGDQQAVRKLASQTAAASSQSAPPPADVVDSARGRLNVKA